MIKIKRSSVVTYRDIIYKSMSYALPKQLDTFKVYFLGIRIYSTTSNYDINSDAYFKESGDKDTVGFGSR